MEDLELEPSAALVLTPEGHKRLQEELSHLTITKRADIAARIRESIDHGEFSEDNSELDEVKQEQAFIENRINDLKAILANAELLEPSQIPTSYVGLGSRVKLNDPERGITFEIRLVATVESNPDDDLISEESPLGQAIIGKKVGETAEFEAPLGRIKYDVASIRR